MRQYDALALNSCPFTAGRLIGGLFAVVQGLGEADAGIGAVGGGLLCTTGVGCVLGGSEAVVTVVKIH
jgi:hypothetical protein